MAMNLRWVGIDQRERVAEARMRAIGLSSKELVKFKESIVRDHGTCPTEFLLAEVDGEAVGTATPLSLWMWARGNRVACQGVAYVGTSRISRRGAGPSKTSPRASSRSRKASATITAARATK